ncbi:MAG: hypothetical protein RL186_573, partial [Pseudomonadota bacterium]
MRSFASTKIGSKGARSDCVSVKLRLVVLCDNFPCDGVEVEEEFSCDGDECGAFGLIAGGEALVV